MYISTECDWLYISTESDWLCTFTEWDWLYISTEWDWLCTCLYLRNETAWVHVGLYIYRMRLVVYIYRMRLVVYIYRMRLVVYMYISTEWDWLYISTEWDWLWHGLWHDPLCKYISTEWDWLYLQNEIGYVHVYLQNETGYGMDCDMLPLFELGSVHHESYLLNIRLPTDATGVNTKFGKLYELSVIVSSHAIT